MDSATCEVCGNVYEASIVIRTPRDDGREHTFDSFECAIHALAPRCGHCGIRIVGHGVQQDDRMFCCASCARREGATGVVDHADGDATQMVESAAAPTRPPSDE